MDLVSSFGGCGRAEGVLRLFEEGGELVCAMCETGTWVAREQY